MIASFSAQDWAFTAVAVVGIIAALRMVTTKNVVHGALYLVIALSMIGAGYLVMAAEFVAWVQIIIYVGAIVVLLLFALMLTKAPIGREALDNQQRGISSLVALAVLAGLVFLVLDAFRSQTIPLPGPAPQTTTGQIGESLFRAFVAPFEIVSILLLAALIGAIAIARKDDPVHSDQHPAARTAETARRER
ncbi:MAG TPA: NADH-quinone oxidoreductase subunit J [Actinomycetota bacterium]